MKRSEDDDGLGDAPVAGGSAGEHAQIALGDGWTAGLSAIAGGAVLRIGGRPGGADPHGGSMEIVISLTSAGPVLRVRAAALEVVAAQDIVARCENFRVEARQDVTLAAGGNLKTEGRRVEVAATHGSVRVEANDNVQLLGENLLLNCDGPPAPVPGWVGALAALPVPALPVEHASGDPSLVAAVIEEGRGEREPE
jgi:hypothetical protein